MTTKDQTIQKLRDELDGAHDDADYADSEAMQAESTVDEVVAILKRHGDHTRQCAKIHGQRYYMEPVECDCGWDDVVKEYL